MKINYISSIDTHNFTKKILKMFTSSKKPIGNYNQSKNNKEQVRTLSQQNQHTHHDEHEEKNLQ